MDKIKCWQLILLKIKWSPWNPWCLGRMNLAWTKYTQTPMYEGRKQLEKEQPSTFKDFSYKAFYENHEINYFISCFSKKEKIKLFLAPFSFGRRFRAPFYKLEDWVFGPLDEI